MMEEFFPTTVPNGDRIMQASTRMSLTLGLGGDSGFQQVPGQTTAHDFFSLMADNSGADTKVIAEEQSQGVRVGSGTSWAPPQLTVQNLVSAPESAPGFRTPEAIHRPESNQATDGELDTPQHAEAVSRNLGAFLDLRAAQVPADAERFDTEPDRDGHSPNATASMTGISVAKSEAQGHEHGVEVVMTVPEKHSKTELAKLERSRAQTVAVSRIVEESSTRSLTAKAGGQSDPPNRVSLSLAPAVFDPPISEGSTDFGFVSIPADSTFGGPLPRASTTVEVPQEDPATAPNADTVSTTGTAERGSGHVALGQLGMPASGGEGAAVVQTNEVKVIPRPAGFADMIESQPQDRSKITVAASAAYVAPDKKPSAPRGSVQKETEALQAVGGPPGMTSAVLQSERLRERTKEIPDVPRSDPQTGSQDQSRAIRLDSTSRLEGSIAMHSLTGKGALSRETYDSDALVSHAEGHRPESRSPARSDALVAVRSDTTSSRAVFAQIRDMVVSSNRQATEIQLSPEELGRVRLTFSAGDAAQLIAIHVERPETLDLVRRHLDALKAELAQAGYDTTDVDLSSGGENKQWQQDHSLPESNAADEVIQSVPMLAVSESQGVAQSPGLADDRLDLRL
ncbi:MAG: flagellar hook-length control protein FliK [Roseobacter sp.]|jgi:hypothetical protein|nr:flagellar hook-length control protein FliK [Roseobacter sp.]